MHKQQVMGMQVCKYAVILVNQKGDARPFPLGTLWEQPQYQIRIPLSVGLDYG